LRTDWFDPFCVLNGRKILRLRSGFRLRVPARLNASPTPAKRLNTDPSTTLGTSARGSDAAKTPQLYKKQALIRKSVNALDFTGVRCQRIVYGLSSIRKPCSLEVLLQRGGAEARRKMGLTRAQCFRARPARHTSPSADWLRSRVLTLFDFFACGYESRRPAGCIQFSKNSLRATLLFGSRRETTSISSNSI